MTELEDAMCDVDGCTNPAVTTVDAEGGFAYRCNDHAEDPAPEIGEQTAPEAEPLEVLSDDETAELDRQTAEFEEQQRLANEPQPADDGDGDITTDDEAPPG